jgi:UDP-GlcNAc:undecaprenyl-phosphate/decaprenyl-phosphate GlcNAc-1-phosphate transferase
MMLKVLIMFALTAGLLQLLIPRAGSLGLVDTPGGHKAHVIATPALAGLAICLAMIVLSLSLPLPALKQSYLIGFLTLFMVGIIDDRRHLGPRIKLLLTVLALSASQLPFGVVLWHLGGLLPVDITETSNFAMLGWFAMLAWLALTLFAMTTCINAFNMIDGVDGLAGGISAVALLWLAVLAGLTEESAVLGGIALKLLGGILAFLIFNVRLADGTHARVYLGNAGSLAVGFSLVWLCIAITQNGGIGAAAPVVMLWIMAVPLFDLVAVMVLRARSGRPVTLNDRQHAHHLLLALGLSVSATAGVLTAVAFIAGAVGIGLWLAGVHDGVSLGLLLLLGVSYLYWFLASWHQQRSAGSQPQSMLVAGQQIEPSGQ